MRRQLVHIYKDIISTDNLLGAWREFLKGKRNKSDVQLFQYNFLDNILHLHNELKNKSYEHGRYYAFNISDPKPRNIHRAEVRDRLLHHAIHRILYPFFHNIFIADSFSCQKWKGTHRAVNRFRKFGYKVSHNCTRTAWVLKCDIRKFFASIDHTILFSILEKYIPDKEIVWLLNRVVESFESTCHGKGLPLGNLTSQLLVNIYMNEFDRFMKHKVKSRYYIRYADDFVILSEDRKWLEGVLFKIKDFLFTKLKLELHPNKVSITTLSSGIDFLGWVNFPDHRVMRTVTKKRMFRNIEESEGKLEVVKSYLGLLSQGNGRKLQDKIIIIKKPRK